jgi:hypothetical protein
MANAIEDFVVDLLLRGREEGRVEGREEGQVAERRAVLLEILALRFRPVPANIVERLDQVADLMRLR